MAEPPPPPPSGAPAAPIPPAPAPKPKPPNPALRMMGIPNIKFKLPSRNWLIFLSISGTFASLFLYDRHQKNLAQEKWCRLVSPLAKEPLPTMSLPRRVTVYLCAPPGDGLGAARRYFKEYVKPVLTAAAVDWEVVEGREEGDIRGKVVAKIREARRKAGEGVPQEEEQDEVQRVREIFGVTSVDALGGDIVVGRHTWKEYIRGQHEGWLSPLDVPAPPSPAPSPPAEASTDAEADAKADADAEAKPEPAARLPPPLFPPTSYGSSSLPTSIPATFDPTAPIPFPHILGFLKTPIRTYRFLTRRYLADDIGRRVAAVVLESSRPFSSSPSSPSSSDTLSGFVSDTGSPTASGSDGADTGTSEITGAMANEEPDWPKRIRHPPSPKAKPEPEAKEGTASNDEAEPNSPVSEARLKEEEADRRIWMSPVVVDSRITERMRVFELTAENEERAGRVLQEKELVGKEEV